MAFIIFFFALILGSFPRKLKKKDDGETPTSVGETRAGANSFRPASNGVNRMEAASTFQEEAKGRKLAAESITLTFQFPILKERIRPISSGRSFVCCATRF